MASTAIGAIVSIGIFRVRQDSWNPGHIAARKRVRSVQCNGLPECLDIERIALYRPRSPQVGMMLRCGPYDVSA